MMRKIFLLFTLKIIVLMVTWPQTVQAQLISAILIDFETPSLGANPRQLINPYVDAATGVTFTAEPVRPGFGDEVVGLVKNNATSACVEPPDDNQKLGTGRSIFPEGSVGLSGFPIKATFPTSLAPPVTISVEFQTLAETPIRLRLFDASGTEAASVTDSALPADGTCGFPDDPRARKTVSATSAQAVAYAIMDLSTATGGFVFVIDNFKVESPTPPIGTTFGPPSSSNPSGTSAEPVNTATGNYFFQRTDLALPGRGLLAVLTRTYNTLDSYSGPFGHGWTHSYNIFLAENTDGTVVIKQGDGHEEFYDPIGDGNYQSRFGGVFNTLVKNPDETETFTLTLKDQTRQEFSASGKLTHISDRNGNALSFSYDAEGNLTAITDTVDRTITLGYDIHNRIIQLTDPIGRRVQYSYDAEGNLESDTDPNGGVMRYSYDVVHRVTQITDPRGNTLLKNSYDTAGRVVAQTNARGITTKFAYGVPQAGDTSITDPLENATIHTHDNQFRLLEVTDPLGKKVTLTYGEDNNRTSITDKNGNVTRLAYDDRGNVASITDPLLNVMEFTYDARNNLTSVIDARRFTTAFIYDAKGNLTSVRDALENITTFAYNGFGQIRKTTDARHNVTRYAYDDQGNLRKITDALGGITIYRYDGIGRLVRVTDPKGHRVTARYDANSRVIQIVDALKHVTGYAYDPVGNLVEVTDAKGHKTEYTYDEVNNLTTVIDALGHITRYTYNANNNRIGVTNAKGATRTYAFDELNRPIRIIDPLGEATTYAYDAAGNVVAVMDANGTTTTFTYNANNLLKEIAYGDGSSVTYSYDANGNRVSMEDQRGTTAYTYDALDQLIEVNHPDGRVVSYGYDAVGQKTRLTYPDGRTASYDYDGLNRLIGVKDLQGRTRYSYDAASNLRRIIYPNHTSISYRYDAADELLKVAHKRNDDTLAKFRYSFDELGNRTGMKQRGPIVPELTFSYAYDALSQLIAEEHSDFGGPIKRTEYTYDPTGNRLTDTVSRDSLPGEIINYTYDVDDRLLQAGNTTFTYDANGNRLTEETPGDNSIDYAYDSANRLIQVARDERVVVYAYDGDGNKVEQEISVGLGSTEALQFLNDVATALPVVLEENRVKEGGLNEATHYLYGLALISEELAHLGRRPQKFFYHSDGLGSTIALTDRAGRTQAEYQYDAWGNLDRSFGDVPNRFLFTGEEQDPESGLYYLRARFYDPKVGRFLTKDPFGGSALLPQSINEYIYALNNPINLIDPTGEFSIKKIGKGLKNLGKGIAKGAQAIAKNPVGAFFIRVGLTAAGCAVGTFAGGPGLGTAAGCAVGAAGAELALAGLRGEFGCIPTGAIVGRALLAGAFAGAVGTFSPSLLKPLTTGEVSAGASALGLSFGDELFTGGVIRGMSAAAMGIAKPTRWNQKTAESSVEIIGLFMRAGPAK